MKLHFQISKEAVQKMPEEEYEAVEMAMDGEVKLYRLRPVLARFLVDENGKAIEHKQAMKILGQIALNEWQDVVTQFVEGIRDSTVPKMNGNLSEQHSEASEAA